VFEQIAIGFFGVAAVFLSQDRRPNYRRWACVFGLIGQPFWFLAAVKSGQWGIFVLCCFYTASWARGVWINWIQRAPATVEAELERNLGHQGNGTA